MNIANAYHTAYTGGSLSYNDQSLPLGGKFDLSNNWADGGSHSEHRVGINCDVDSSGVAANRWSTLVQIFVDNGSPNYIDETASANHWHLRF